MSHKRADCGGGRRCARTHRGGAGLGTFASIEWPPCCLPHRRLRPGTPVRITRDRALPRRLALDAYSLVLGRRRFVLHSDPRSNLGAVWLLLDRVPAPSANICATPTSVDNVEEAARLYEAELHRFYG